jgi:Rod binding domain-containing protein
MTPNVPPLDLLRPAAAAPEPRTRAAIEKTAHEFEAAFISQMLNQMFAGVEVSAPFGGGPGEAAFKSFLIEAMGKQMAAQGGLGLADDLQREMLRMQGLD